MPSTAVYFEARPLSIALIAACLMLSGVSKSGSPGAEPDHVAARLFERTRLVGHRDGGRRLDALQGLGQEGHRNLRFLRGVGTGRRTATASRKARFDQ
jgi:hypothetical protein